MLEVGDRVVIVHVTNYGSDWRKYFQWMTGFVTDVYETGSHFCLFPKYNYTVRVENCTKRNEYPPTG